MIHRRGRVAALGLRNVQRQDKLPQQRVVGSDATPPGQSSETGVVPSCVAASWSAFAAGSTA